ncbi:protein FAM135B-like protein isoform X1 [Gossypium australe]|uniref:Protein FAM135B-like protein isoform X1 n=1 Tax=Gossypium australe TaxID=47621 RepID=A0A5B6W6U1_9ROSI|nr:protein FAM135B-like protein isoform X1 [Gossypium australe]
MLRRLGWLIGLNNRSVQAKKLPDAKPHPAEVQPVVMLDSVQEIAIYIHRFHYNLDLFQQGWYQLKLTVRWDNDEYAPVGTPARVVQYEAPSLVSDEVFGVWRIDDTDNSFATQPFRIKYARQDVYLSIMVAFDLPIPENEGPPSSAVILKFELLYAPVLVNGSDFQASPDYFPAAIHEFQIPPKALLGLHSYCPVYFDAFHAVLVDVSVHTTLLKAGSHKVHTKVPRFVPDLETMMTILLTNHIPLISSSGPFFRMAVGVVVMFDYVVDQALDQVASTDLKQFMLVKALLNARDTLLAELQRLSDAINHAVDLTEFTSKMNDMKLFDSFLQEPVAADAEDSAQGKPQNGLERVNGRLEFQSDRLLHNLSKDDVLKIFNLSGDQVFYLWNTFLNFHRDSKTRIRGEWAKDRRAEWSIWMVYSKVDMPHRYINGSFDQSSHQILHKRGSSLWKLTYYMNNRSIQDMQIFGDPSGIPIVIIEHVINAPQRASSDNLYMRN